LEYLFSGEMGEKVPKKAIFLKRCDNNFFFGSGLRVFFSLIACLLRYQCLTAFIPFGVISVYFTLSHTAGYGLLIAYLPFTLRERKTLKMKMFYFIK